MTSTQIATRTNDRDTQQSPDDQLVNAIRNGKLIEIPWRDLTKDEKRAAHVAMFHQNYCQFAMSQGLGFGSLNLPIE